MKKSNPSLVVLATLTALALVSSCERHKVPGEVVLAENGKSNAEIVVDGFLVPAKEKTPVKARYLRIEHNDALILSEVEIIDAGGTNIAKGKPATQNATWKDEAVHGPQALVDGVIGPDNYISTGNTPNDWWEVDLGKEYDITRLVVHPRKVGDGCCCYRRYLGAGFSLLDAQRQKKWGAVFETARDQQVVDDFAKPKIEGAWDTRLPNAIEDLASYLKKVTGAEFPVVAAGSETPGKTHVFVGRSAAEKLGADKNALAIDEWKIEAKDGNLYLFGGNRYGDSSAIFHFLEDVVGVRWWTPNEETVPAKPTLVVAPQSLQGNPAFGLRNLSGLGGAAFTRLDERRRHTDYESLYAVGHAWRSDFSLLNTLNKYEGNQFEKHPEWFSKDKSGKMIHRDYPGHGMVHDFCYSSVTPETEDILARAVIKTVQEAKAANARNGKQQAVYMVDLCMDDNAPRCECEKCTAEASFGDLWVRFFNRVADKVKAVEPDALLHTIPYMHYDQPPRKNKVADNIMLSFSVTGMTFDKNINDPANAHEKAKLDGWSAVGGKPGVDVTYYYGKCATIKAPVGITPSNGTNYWFKMSEPEIWLYPDFLRAIQGKPGGGGLAMGMWIARDRMDNWELTDWMLSRLLEDPNQNENALMDEFLNGYYGPAGPYVRKFLELVRDSSAKQSGNIGWFVSLYHYKYFDNDFLIAAQKIFADARKSLAGKPDEKVYARRLRGAWVSATRPLLAHWNLFAQRWVASGNKLEDLHFNHARLLEDYKAALKEYMEFVDSHQLSGDALFRYNSELELIGGIFEPAPLPEPFRDLPRADVFDFPVSSNEFLIGDKQQVTREKDPAAGGREVLVIRGAAKLWPLRFFNNSIKAPPVKELADPAQIHDGEYAWYDAGRYQGKGGADWRGNLMFLFGGLDFGFPGYGLISLGTTDIHMGDYQAFVEMKVTLGPDKKPEEIRVARVILLTGAAIKELRAKLHPVPDLQPPAATTAEPMKGRYVRLSHPTDRVMVSEVGVFSGGKNVAKFKPATQKGVWHDYFDPDRAVDGDPNPASLMTDENSQISTGPAGWWEVDLQTTVPIDQIVVWNIAPPNDARQVGLKVEVLDENRNAVKTSTVTSAAEKWTFDSNSTKYGK